jgi:catechol 2,3-dioxygenase-like lactoylglutathione lyase family enzyme
MNIDPITINATDLDRSTRFYSEGLAKLEVLGARQRPRSRQKFATAQGAVDVGVGPSRVDIRIGSAELWHDTGSHDSAPASRNLRSP